MQQYEKLEYGKFYHIYNHAVGGRNIFHGSSNYEYFLSLYDKHITPVAETYAWVLMRNHFHLLVKIRDLNQTGFENLSGLNPEVTAQIKVLIEFATKILNVKVCLMTATLPTFLKKELTDAIGEHSEICADAKLYKSFNRHRIKVVNGLLSENVKKIQDRLNSGDKVLVVSNTVKQAQSLYNSLETSKKVLLHSAFNGIDRNVKEAELMLDDVRLLVGTQAIEVSLDIDYDVIFTEPAPLDALLQRFGRVNRHRVDGNYRPPCDCIVFSKRNDVDKYIYKNEDVISRTLDVLKNIQSKNSGVVTENQLQFYIDQVYPNWSEKEYEDFNQIYKHLKTDVLENLSPFIYDKHREEEFEKQFSGIKVLPSSLKKEYKELMEANKFIKAESLKVSITTQRFASLISNDGIHQDVLAFQLLKKEEIKEQPYFIINRKYDDELGLQLDVEEKVFDAMIF